MTIHEELAARLRAAYHSGPVPPLRDGLDPQDLAGAYAVQAANTKYWSAAGRRIVGRKIGLTAKTVQAQLGVSQPDFGVLFDDMKIDDGGVLTSGSMLQAKAEAEIAFIMAVDISDVEVTPERVAGSVAYAVPAIEVVDSRIANWNISLADTVADNGSSAFFVLGGDRKPLAGLDLFSCGMVMQVNGDVLSLGAGAACLGHPLNAATWLVRELAARGEGLRAGDVVLTGALGPMVLLRTGDSVKATIGGLGAVSFRCEKNGAVGQEMKRPR
jgi:2-keto-4-pentenoate hydratase